MSIDSSLKTKSRLVRSRNVLKRDERLKVLAEQDRWEPGKPVLGIPKTRVVKAATGKKKK